MSKSKIISPVVDIVVQLIAADHVIKGNGKPNRNRPGKNPFSKLSADDLKRVRKEAKDILENPESMLAYLYSSEKLECNWTHTAILSV